MSQSKPRPVKRTMLNHYGYDLIMLYPKELGRELCKLYQSPIFDRPKMLRWSFAQPIKLSWSFARAKFLRRKKCVEQKLNHKKKKKSFRGVF